jgi:predicted MFS family arabinose efflux permease
LLQVAGAVSGPFALEAYLSCKRFTNKRTYHVALLISITFGISSFLVVPFSRCLPALACLLFIFGVSQATTETLVYIHVARRLEQLGKHVATHVSMCMFTIALALGAGLGNMVGGALQQQNWAVQLWATSAMAGVTGLYGCVLSLIMVKVASGQV